MTKGCDLPEVFEFFVCGRMSLTVPLLMPLAASAAWTLRPPKV